MAYDISEIKKLSTGEKLQIIDELWQTIEGNEETAEDISDEDPEVTTLLQERVEKYERGEGVFYDLEDAKKIVDKKLKEFRKIKND